MVAHFDGGAARGVGVGGFIVWGANGDVLGAFSMYFGEDAPTNNAAESWALLALM